MQVPDIQKQAHSVLLHPFCSYALVIRSNHNMFDREQIMTERMFRLLELYQKLDTVIQRNSQSGDADSVQMTRLQFRQKKLKQRLRQITSEFAVPVDWSRSALISA